MILSRCGRAFGHVVTLHVVEVPNLVHLVWRTTALLGVEGDCIAWCGGRLHCLVWRATALLGVEGDYIA